MADQLYDLRAIEPHLRAWRLPIEPDEDHPDGYHVVLVEEPLTGAHIPPEGESYWWVLDPADATLYFERHVDDPAGPWEASSTGNTDWAKGHAAAEDFVRARIQLRNLSAGLDEIERLNLACDPTTPAWDPNDKRGRPLPDEVTACWVSDWRADCVAPDGTLDLDQIKAELTDYSALMHATSTVYCDVTGGRISKPHTVAGAVISVHDELCIRRADIDWEQLEARIGDELTNPDRTREVLAILRDVLE